VKPCYTYTIARSKLVTHGHMHIFFFNIRFWYLRCCGCPWNRGRQHLATPLKTCHNIEAGFLTGWLLPIPQLRVDGIWDSAVPALGLCACRCPRKRGIICLATMTCIMPWRKGQSRALYGIERLCVKWNQVCGGNSTKKVSFCHLLICRIQQEHVSYQVCFLLFIFIKKSYL